MNDATRCHRCHRPLTSAASITRGAGRTCATRIRREAAIAEMNAKPVQVAKAFELIADRAIVARDRARRAFDVVASNGTDRYLTTAATCTCPAGTHDRLCYHRIAATALAA